MSVNPRPRQGQSALTQATFTMRQAGVLSSTKGHEPMSRDHRQPFAHGCARIALLAPFVGRPRDDRSCSHPALGALLAVAVSLHVPVRRPAPARRCAFAGGVSHCPCSSVVVSVRSGTARLAHERSSAAVFLAMCRPSPIPPDVSPPPIWPQHHVTGVTTCLALGFSFELGSRKVSEDPQIRHVRIRPVRCSARPQRGGGADAAVRHLGRHGLGRGQRPPDAGRRPRRGRQRHEHHGRREPQHAGGRGRGRAAAAVLRAPIDTSGRTSGGGVSEKLGGLRCVWPRQPAKSPPGVGSVVTTASSPLCLFCVYPHLV